MKKQMIEASFYKAQLDIRSQENADKAMILQRFFKTGIGQYGAGDRFLGITVPLIRNQVRSHADALSIDESELFLKSPWHEERLFGLLVLVRKFEKWDLKQKKKITDCYLRNTDYINNWDLVDLSAPKIVGAYCHEMGDDSILDTLAFSSSLWERRIAILSTFYYIYQGDASVTYCIAQKLLGDKHDLIHKAVGWMLREAGKRVSLDELRSFLDQYAMIMPRTMLRYAIERMDKKEREKYMNIKKA